VQHQGGRTEADLRLTLSALAIGVSNLLSGVSGRCERAAMSADPSYSGMRLYGMLEVPHRNLVVRKYCTSLLAS
jgi:hypothetical protein